MGADAAGGRAGQPHAGRHHDPRPEPVHVPVLRRRRGRADRPPHPRQRHAADHRLRRAQRHPQPRAVHPGRSRGGAARLRRPRLHALAGAHRRLLPAGRPRAGRARRRQRDDQGPVRPAAARAHPHPGAGAQGGRRVGAAGAALALAVRHGRAVLPRRGAARHRPAAHRLGATGQRRLTAADPLLRAAPRARGTHQPAVDGRPRRHVRLLHRGGDPARLPLRRAAALRPGALPAPGARRHDLQPAHGSGPDGHHRPGAGDPRGGRAGTRRPRLPDPGEPVRAVRRHPGDAQRVERRALPQRARRGAPLRARPLRPAGERGRPDGRRPGARVGTAGHRAVRRARR